MPGPERGARFDLGDIVRTHRSELDSLRPITPQQRRVLTDIANCRTAVLGGHLDRCARCGYEHPSYNSCRNRHCPKCQALAQEIWIGEQRARMLDVRHFHVVFTLPAELRPLAAFAPRVVYNILFTSAWDTLRTFARSRLSATLGATLVLHTWTRKLELHPHVHVIVTGGGLTRDGQGWSTARRSFLFPVKAMSRVFRGKTIAALRQALRAGHLAGFSDFHDPEGFARLTSKLARLSWNVYAKPSFSRAEHVVAYLGRYTHRVGLANSRLLDVTAGHVTFRTKGDGTLTLSPVELLRRFVLHVLPEGFHKIRHAGLYGSPQKLEKARALFAARPVSVPRPSWRERLAELTGHDVLRCPHCEAPLSSVPIPAARAPPLVS